MTETALVLIDFQSEWTTPGTEYYVWDIPEVLGKVNYLIDHCRAREYKIIRTKHREPDSIDAFGPETHIIPQLNQQESDTVMIKNKISPFYHTSLDQELEWVKHVIVCGILTNLCVRSFIEDAYDRDMKITVIKDCCVAHTPELQDFTFYDLAQTRDEIDFAELKTFTE